jgi:putative oxidoreductase
MKTGVLIARLLLGAIFLVFGLNEFLGFLPVPELTGKGVLQISGSITTGHAYAILFAFLEVAAAGLLLTNLYVPLALALLAPVIAKALIFHILTEPAALPFVAIQLILWGVLAWVYRERFRGLVSGKFST